MEDVSARRHRPVAEDLRFTDEQLKRYFGSKQAGGSIDPIVLEPEKSWNTLGTWNYTDDGMKLVVPYAFSDAVNNASKWEQLRDNVAEAVDYFWKTKIRFQEFDLTDVVNQNISYIGITDFIGGYQSTGCSSDVGPSRPPPEVVTIEIGEKECYTKVGMIAHELMHSLGFLLGLSM